MPLGSDISDLRDRLRGDLLPWLSATVGPLTEKTKLFVTVLEMAPVGAFLTSCPGLMGRPPAERVPPARAFMAKAVYGMPTTVLLIDRLKMDKTLRQLCGWHRAGAIPSESTFSRAFAEFADSELPCRVHEAVIVSAYQGRLVGHAAALRGRHQARRQGPQDGLDRLQAAPRHGRRRCTVERHSDLRVAASRT